jgi:deazaflavin-dependent oxidoreductase (nitroreductase family)
MTDDAIGEELAGWGKVAWLETTGRTSGNPATAAVGFVEESDGSLLVAAGSESADWALNLHAKPRCLVTISDVVGWYDAMEVTGAERDRAVVELILKYGTPAEKLGRGPVFRLKRQSD